MSKILTFEQAIKISGLVRRQGKIVVLAGGCFDVLHPGHLAYLKQAEKQGDVLFVFLESDENVRRLKGEGRPVNSQQKRAENLARLEVVNYVVLLPVVRGYKGYFEITKSLAPQIIAITQGDPKQEEKERQAKEIGATVAVVTKLLKNFSTTKIINQQ